MKLFSIYIIIFLVIEILYLLFYLKHKIRLRRPYIYNITYLVHFILAVDIAYLMIHMIYFIKPRIEHTYRIGDVVWFYPQKSDAVDLFYSLINNTIDDVYQSTIRDVKFYAGSVVYYNEDIPSFFELDGFCLEYVCAYEHNTCKDKIIPSNINTFNTRYKKVRDILD